jgi:hypothetical protein
MGEPGAEQVAFVIDENLRLVLKAPESGGMYYPIAVALKFAASGG